MSSRNSKSFPLVVSCVKLDYGLRVGNPNICLAEVRSFSPCSIASKDRPSWDPHMKVVRRHPGENAFSAGHDMCAWAVVSADFVDFAALLTRQPWPENHLPLELGLVVADLRLSHSRP